MGDDLPVRLRERADARDLAREYLEPVATLLREAAAEIERLRLRLERDAATYATMQKGMESQAELADALKQETRSLRAAAALALEWLDGRQDNRAGDEEAARALRAALGPAVTPAPPTAGDLAEYDDTE